MKIFEHYGKINKFKSIKDFIDTYEIKSNVLILTSNGIYSKYLQQFELNTNIIFHDDFGKGEPSDLKIDEIIKKSKAFEYSTILAIGGGTVMDIAKILRLKTPEKSADYFLGKKDLIKNKKLICIPTTCGTGSEVTNISVSKITEKDTKMGLANEALYADEAILIPEFLKNLPFKVFMHSSIDALIHAFEAYLSPNASDISDILSYKAIKNILEIYNEIDKNGDEERYKYLDKILLSSTLAGISFNNAGVGAVHALSYPLGAKYHVPHGESNFQFFTEVMKVYNHKNPEGKIQNLNRLIEDTFEFRVNIYDKLNSVFKNLIKKPNLKEYGMTEDEIQIFTDRVIETQQRLMKNNYVPLDKKEIMIIYRNLY